MINVISSDPKVISAMLFIWSFILGIIISLFISFYNRKVIGSFFRAIIKADATDPESAKTLDEIGQKENDAVITKLERSASYRDIVAIVNPDGSEEDKICAITITEETRFYIPEDQITHVRNQWGEKNENLLVLIGGVAGMLILGIILTIIVIAG
jgi:hypothetical protein